MKVSKVIDEICMKADDKFAITGHSNDACSVHTYSSGSDWQVCLTRPTQKQLDSGEIDDDNLHTVKQYEYLTGFYVVAPTLVAALNELHRRVDDAIDWEQ